MAHGADKAITVYRGEFWKLSQSHAALTPHLFTSPDMIMSSCSISIRCQFSIFHSLPLRPSPQPVNTLSQSWALSCSGAYTGGLRTIEKIDRRKDHIKHFESGKRVVYRHFRFLIFWFTLTSINPIDQISRHTYLHMYSPLPPSRTITTSRMKIPRE